LTRRSAITVLFGSASRRVVSETLARLDGLDLVVVSEFPPETGEWIPYHIHRSWSENRALIQARLAGREIEKAIILTEHKTPYWRLRALAVSLAPGRFFIINEVGHATFLERTKWRGGNFFRWHLRSNGPVRRLLRAFTSPEDFRLPALYRFALARGRILAATRPSLPAPVPTGERPAGVSVVIPSRNGRDLLETCLPGLSSATEIIVVDNGSDDETVDWLARAYPSVLVEHSATPLTFAVAMNRGIRRARYSHLCALNNDMVVEPGFLEALRAAFDSNPNLFCASAQIFLPDGQRREETGKTVINPSPGVTDFPIRCDLPLEGEDQSYVLYGSGGCSLYDAAKLTALGGFDEIYEPAYVEDLDLGVRAWSCGWPTVYCASARVLHQHRTTTSRYYSEAQLDLALDLNYTRFLARAIANRELFARMWDHNTLRLKAQGKAVALKAAANIDAVPVIASDDRFFDLVNGQVSVFPGRARSTKPVILIASPYLPFPLSHGAAVRIFNLIREGASDFDFVLIAFLEDSRPVPRELLDLCVEVVTVHRLGTHAPPSRGRPDTVEEFDSPAFHAALRQTMTKWRPSLAQLEFTQMAIYAPDCAPAKTILVEHDITYDLYAQMLARPETSDWEMRRQHELWVNFENEAWRNVDSVVTMSEKDRAIVGSKAIAIGNGVDLERFQPSTDAPEPRRLLFIGSFAHKPNVLALEFFLREVFPLLKNVTLHVIAGQNHKRFWDLQHEGVEVDGFISDVRPPYRRATLVIAPLVASAGTNVKIVEAMAIGKAIVSTDAGIHGLELETGKDVIVANTPQTIAEAITRLLESPTERAELEIHARATAERIYGWKAMAAVQKQLYRRLL
jgi:GT2 family glycosyltransferase/glycosyltransferase involved in cell wall biosynthesis